MKFAESLKSYKAKYTSEGGRLELSFIMFIHIYNDNHKLSGSLSVYLFIYLSILDKGLLETIMQLELELSLKYSLCK